MLCFFVTILRTKWLKSEKTSQKNIKTRSFLKKRWFLKQTIAFAYANICDGKEINIGLVNEMHKKILNSVRGAERSPGEIRVTQNWIGPRGVCSHWNYIATNVFLC